MANQSFPPVSLLRGLRTLRLNLEIPEFKDALDQEALEEKIKSIVTASGVRFVDQSITCDALLNAKIMVIATTSHGDGSPFSLAYIVRLTVLTTVSYHTSAELFIVFDDLNFGSTGPMFLSKTIMKQVGSGAQALAEKLKPPVAVTQAAPADSANSTQPATDAAAATTGEPADSAPATEPAQ